MKKCSQHPQTRDHDINTWCSKYSRRGVIAEGGNNVPANCQVDDAPHGKNNDDFDYRASYFLLEQSTTKGGPIESFSLQHTTHAFFQTYRTIKSHLKNITI
jgi:hypothetical protein